MVIWYKYTLWEDSYICHLTLFSSFLERKFKLYSFGEFQLYDSVIKYSHFLLHSVQFSQNKFSRSVMSNSLQPHGMQNTRLPCSSPTPGAYSNSCPLSRWCHPTISCSVAPFSSHLQSFPASASFPMSWLFTSGGQSIGTSASVLPMNIQDWFPLGLILQFKGLSRVFSSTMVQKHQFFGAQLSLWSSSHIHTLLLGKP